MKLATCEQMRALDRTAIDRYGIPGLLLMENAARSVFDECRELDAYTHKKAAVLCGTGNNGGDGFAIARHMHNDGADVLILLFGDSEKISGDAKTNYDICRSMQMNIREWGGADTLAGYPLIVDAILGTGVSGELHGEVREAVAGVNKSNAYVVAVDCPTGGDPDTGRVSDICVQANLTVTLALPKPGLLLYPLAGRAGRLAVGGISAPKEIFDEFEASIFALDAGMAAKLLPERHEDSHKGTYGRVAVVAGSKSMTGAAAFCANAAYKSGCGYVDICAPESAIRIIQQLVPQAVTTPLAEEGGFVCAAAVDRALEQINKSEVCVIGPGLGQQPSVSDFVRGVIKNAKVQLILDADALNSITPKLLQMASVPPIITPHPLEMSRLSGIPTEQILDNILDAAQNFATKYNTITVLKSASTVIAEPSGRIFINKGGCSALAKAGSGDILAGLISGFIAQGMNATEACALAAYVHSHAGRLAAERYGEYSVGCEEVLGSICETIKDFK